MEVPMVLTFALLGVCTLVASFGKNQPVTAKSRDPYGRLKELAEQKKYKTTRPFYAFTEEEAEKVKNSEAGTLLHIWAKRGEEMEDDLIMTGEYSHCPGCTQPVPTSMIIPTSIINVGAKNAA
jgi:hypothetical protein